MIQFQQADLEQFYSPFQILAFAVSPDESKIVMSCNLGSGNYNLWCLDLEQPFPYPLTSHGQQCDGIYLHQDGQSGETAVFFTADKDGDEAHQLYAIPIEGGAPTPVLSAEGKRFFMAGVSDDGKRLYYASNKDRPMYLNLYRYHLDDGVEEVLYEGTGAANYLISVNPSENSFAFTTQFGRTKSPVHIVSDGEVISPVPIPEAVHVGYQVEFIDNKHIYLLTNYDEEFSYLASYDFDTREFKKLCSIEGQELRMMARSSTTGDILMIGAQGVQDFLYRFKPTTSEVSQVMLPVDSVYQMVVTKNGNLYVSGSSSRCPHNIYRYEEEKGWTALTQNRVAGVKTRDLVEPDVYDYPSFDGRRIEALHYRANPDTANGHTILWPHGGPQHIERKDYNPTFQYLASLGYNIFCPNFRGSMFYGAGFHKLVEQDWGGGPRMDMISGTEWLIAEGLAERGNMFLFGGSYGGYMVLLLLGLHGDMFKASVDLFGPTNLLTFVEHVPDYWKPRMEAWVGHPVRDREKLIEQSPITYVDSMNRPLMVYQGANDARVGKSESDQIVEAMKNRGVDVKYVVFDDAGHAMRKEQCMEIDRAVAAFFAEYL